MENIIIEYENELYKNSDTDYAMSMQRFFKEKIDCIGVRSATIKKINASFYKRISNLSRQEKLVLAKQAFCMPKIEFTHFALFLLSKLNFSSPDLPYFEKIILTHIDNWATCDTLCLSSLGKLLWQNPQLTATTYQWTADAHIWLKRAAAVSLIVGIKKGVFEDICFDFADRLLTDKHDMVQKGYGWMLKVLADKQQAKVFDYIMKNKDSMPRTALRYAIEKMPAPLKMEAMAK